MALALMALLGSTVLTPAARKVFVASPAKEGSDLTWTGSASIREGSPWGDGLRSPQREPPLTSATYTSGFDKKAAGLGPLPPETPPIKLAQTRDPHACPDDLNCSFRPAKAGAVPPRRPLIVADAEPAKASQAPTGLALLTASLHWPAQLPGYLPTPNTLLTPFTFVGNTVVGLVKKL
jgi:hypothetical protein